jgi:hypothetical protein
MTRTISWRTFEDDIRSALGGVVTVFTHLEPAEDELSMEDMHLDR